MFNKKKIILAGGGTGGSVTPLLALADSLKNEFSFLFVGTYSGIENKLVAAEGWRLTSILSGKWRRYFSWKNFFDFFKILFAFFQSLFLLFKERPSLIVSAGGFVGVPLSFAAWFLKIPVIIHQQDVCPGLANKLLAPLAKVITVTFPPSLKDYGGKAVWIGNPTRALNFSVEKNKIKNRRPLVVIVSGGTGSFFINNLVEETITELLVFSDIIHVTGQNKKCVPKKRENYSFYEFLEHKTLLDFISRADVVVSRAGLGSLTELAALKKAVLLIPMPDSHQEKNAHFFKEAKATLVLEEKNLVPNIFISSIKNIIDDNNLKIELQENIGKVMKADAVIAWGEIIKKILE